MRDDREAVEWQSRYSQLIAPHDTGEILCFYRSIHGHNFTRLPPIATKTRLPPYYPEDGSYEVAGRQPNQTYGHTTTNLSLARLEHCTNEV